MKSVMDRLRELREDHDYSQRTVAEVLGISQQHYSKYETGEYELPLHHFMKLAEYYGVSADFLTGRTISHTMPYLEMVYVTKDCTCQELIQDVLSLGEHERESVIEYIKFQKSKEGQR